ncbi:hypothetical protein ACHAXN_013479 [Cyclotella atomus]
MVNYGEALRKARRPGWEDAYLDYEELKRIRNRLEALLIERDDDIAASLVSVGSESPYLQKYFELRTEFADKLHSEIEKISLFSLTRLGELANAVGVLRFLKADPDNKRSSVLSDQDRRFVSYHESGDEESPMDSSHHNYSFILGEKSSLLPSSDRRSVKTPPRKSISGSSAGRLFSRTKLIALVGRQFNDEHDKISIYSDLGVELLHILKYTCVNAAGIRKISKKYAKLINFFPVAQEADSAKAKEDNELLMPKEVAQRYETIADSRIDQITNNKDFATFLVESGDIPDGTALLRFECAMSSIHTLMEFSTYASRPFSVFLSRRAMINTGKDQGELGNAEKKALALLLEFEPDFILDMSESELRQWYIRATHRTRKAGTGKGSSAFIEVAATESGKQWGGVDGKSMIINLMSTLLYTVNYYIIAPTANHYAAVLGLDGAYGATLIGASSFSAIFAAFFYSMWYKSSSFWTALAFSAMCPFIGNIMYSVAITYDSMKMALLGRVLCGFGSAEVVNRQLISACVSYQTMTKASALFVSVSAAALLDLTQGRDENIDLKIHLPGSPPGSGLVFDHITAPGFLMAFLWGLQLLSVMLLFDEPERINGIGGEDEIETKPKLEMEVTRYGSVEDSDSPQAKEQSWSTLWNDTMAIFRVIVSNMAFPVTLYLFAFIELSGEVLISSCSMVVKRYFSWHSSRAGFIIASLGALVLPAHFIVERASRSYSERKIMKYSIIFVMLSCVAICNLEGLVLDVIGVMLNYTKKGPTTEHLKSVITSVLHHNEFPYDWGAGSIVYLIFLSAIFIGSIILEGVNTSLMSKTAPSALNDSFLNMGLLATLVGTMGRVVGDSMITLSAFIGRAPYHDFVSVTFLPLLPILGLGLYWVNKNWKQLV